MSAFAQPCSASITPQSCSNSLSVSASTSAPASFVLNPTTPPNTPPMVSFSQKRSGDDTLSDLSSLSSSPSVSQPTTPPDHSSTALLASTSPSVTCVDPTESPSEKLRVSIAPSAGAELTHANSEAIAAAGQISQLPVILEDEDISMAGYQLPCSSGEPQNDSSHTSSQAIKTACFTKTPNPLQTTNVYINGLPPNFKAEQLYELTSQFGTVISCRTFTRQLSDHPSGYGFVLFDSIEAAQQCIDVLRSHHNLHPTFAKQAHKINRGVIDPAGTSPSSVDSPLTQQQSTNEPHNKKVHNPATLITIDNASPGTDIFIEGLPMNVDVQTLRILLAPHTIRNSQFFADTRVQPPRLVASVKLESQAAAYDVRSKLHGRAIRGYSDRLQVFSESEYVLHLASAQPKVLSPQIGTAWGSTVASGMPMNVQDLFTESEDPFVSLSRDNKPSAQFMLPPFSPRFDNQSALYSDNLRLQALQQQVSHQLSKQSFDQPCIPPQLQPLNASLNQLQAQLDSLRPLLYNYNLNQANTMPSHLELTSPTLTKTHQHSNSFSDQRLSSNVASGVSVQSQNIAPVLRSPQAQNTLAGITMTGKKPSSGSQLNPLAHAYPPKSGNTKAGLGTPLFAHSQSASSMGSGNAAAAKTHSNALNNNIKLVATDTVSAGPQAGGRYIV